MIDPRIDQVLRSCRWKMTRDGTAGVRLELEKLGISEESQIGQFYLKYRGPFFSPVRLPELLDVERPTPEVAEQTEYVRTELGVPEDFVCLTTTEGEGMYLYRISTGEVFDVGFKDVPRLGTDEGVLARWMTFQDFLVEYFGISR